MSFEGMKNDDPPLARETDDRPGGEEAADIRTVVYRLAPSVLVEDVDSDPTEPDDEYEEERNVVNHRQKGQVETGALSAEPRRSNVDEKRDGVAYDANEDDDRQDVCM